MGGLAEILHYLHSRVPMSTQAEHDAVAVLIDGLKAVPVTNPVEQEAVTVLADGLQAAETQKGA